MLLLERPGDPCSRHGEHGDVLVGQCAKQLRKTQVVARHDAYHELAERQHQQLVAVELAWHQGVRLLVAQGVVEVELPVRPRTPGAPTATTVLCTRCSPGTFSNIPAMAGHPESGRGLRQGGDERPSSASAARRSPRQAGRESTSQPRAGRRARHRLQRHSHETECPRAVCGRVGLGRELGDSDLHEKALPLAAARDAFAARGPVLATCPPISSLGACAVSRCTSLRVRAR